MIRASLRDNQDGCEIELDDTFIIGRRDGCQLQIHETKVSRQHAMVRLQEGRYWLYDLGSSNGSYLNGKRIIDCVRLRDGDVVGVGSRRFTFCAEDGSPTSVNMAVEQYSMDQTRLEIRTVPVLMLVSDVKGFSELSEQLPTEVLAQAMSAWYRECKQVLSVSGATVDKFIGDAVLAYWLDVGAPSRIQALEAARRLGGCCERIYDRHGEAFERAGANLHVGCGIHLGEVAHGKMGRDAFTLLGGAVNATFGLEALTRVVGSDVLLSDAVLAGWDDGQQYCESRGKHQVKGRSVPMEVFAVVSWPDGNE
jgi:adenylate cyclase